MKKYLFSLLLAGWSLVAFAEEKAKSEPLFKDGKGFFSYKIPLNEPLPADHKLKVVYFFHYDCTNCVAADDYLKMYAKYNASKVELERYPMFNEGKLFSAKMHATFLEYGRPDLSDLYLFESAGRKSETSLVSNERAIEKWLLDHGVDIVRFKRLYHSPNVQKKVDEYTEINKKYGPPFAPFAGINGKYVLTYKTLYNDDYTYAVLDFLHEKEKNGE